MSAPVDPTHEAILDELPALLTGELSPACEREVAEHLEGCDACRRELAVVARASAWLQDAVRLDVAAELTPGNEDAPMPELPPLQLPRHSWSPLRAGRRSSGVTRPHASRWLAAAAAVVLLVGGVLGGVVLGRASDTAGSGARSVAMAPVPGGLTVPGAAGRAQLAADGGMKLNVKGLPAPSDKDFYEVWLFDPPSGRMLSVGVLPSSGKGSYSLPSALENSYTAVEISLEPNDGNPEHSKVSVLRGPLT
ncbi:MAG TPA: anti-sigma factor [Frankiaceae bacterium]|nr:anti-sigma factor [Frankiaceae bacterium]